MEIFASKGRHRVLLKPGDIGYEEAARAQGVPLPVAPVPTPINPPVKQEVKKMAEEQKPKSTEEPKVVEPKLVEIPILDLEDYEIPKEKEAVIADESKGSVKYAFIGTGQGGSRLAKSFYDLGYKKTIVLNTSRHDLDMLPMPDNQKFFMDIGEEGAGKVMSRGRIAAEKYQQEIFDMMRCLFGQVDQILVCAGAGGGTGGGSIFPLLGVAKKYLKYIGHDKPAERMGAVITLPTAGEASSPQVASNALTVAQSAVMLTDKGEISPLIIGDNDKIVKMYKNLTPAKYWPTITGAVSNLFNIFNYLSSCPSSYTSFDTTDYLSLVRSGGCMVFGLAKIKDYKAEQNISQTMKNVLHSTLLAEGFDLSTARTAASIVVAGKKIMETEAGLMDKINYAFDCMSNMCPNATVHRGIYEDNRDSLRIYTIISGLKMPKNRLAKLGKIESND